MADVQSALRQIRMREAGTEIVQLIDNILAILDEGRAWTKYYAGRTRLGVGTLATSHEAVKFCVNGAMVRALYPETDRSREVRLLLHFYLSVLIGMPMSVYNDQHGRKYEDIKRVLVRARTLIAEEKL